MDNVADNTESHESLITTIIHIGFLGFVGMY